MDAVTATYMVLWLGLLFAAAAVAIVTLWRWFKKRPIKPWVITAISLTALWLCVSPSSDRHWRRHLMEQLFGQVFSPRPVYKMTSYQSVPSEGVEIYVFKIPEARISGITNAATLQSMGLPKEDDHLKEWQTIRWQNAPFSNDTNDVQHLAFSSGGDPAHGVSVEQLQKLMSLPTTLFACSYKTYKPSPTNSSESAYAVNFYILTPDTRRLIIILKSI